jgi:hypothetical protein
LARSANGSRSVQNLKTTPSDSLGKEFAKILDTLNLKRPRLSFYGLRHGFETIGGGSKDQIAVDAIMGHVPQGMSALYRERIEDERLVAVAEHVRRWLFGEPIDWGKADRSPEAEATAATERKPRCRPAPRGRGTRL